MCGLLGYVGENIPDLADSLESLKHRGPDFIGKAVLDNLEMYHLRLKINDLSELGNQPFVSGNVILTANGEVYNYQELKAELEGKYHFRSSSDSEVLLHGYIEWGIDVLLEKLDGMFSFVLYDGVNKRLFLAVDRIGIKPLFYRKESDSFSYASELCGLCQFNEAELKFDQSALFDFLTYGYIPAPKSAYRSIKKLRPASYLEYSVEDGALREKRYWSPLLKKVKYKNRNDAIEKFQSVLNDAVRSQLISDVEVGSLLSGGIDSSAVSYFASKLMRSKLKAFNISFPGSEKDESKYAKILAEDIDLDLISSPSNVEKVDDISKRLLNLYVEPFADTSTEPTSEVFQLAKKYVTVVLSGDGGDELFCGYTRYTRMEKRIRASLILRKIPQSILKVTERILDKIGRKVDLVALSTSDFFEIYADLMYSVDKRSIEIYREKLGIDSAYDRFWHWREAYDDNLSLKRSLMLLDLQCYLPGDILTKVDRCSMRYTLEARVPLLANKVVDFALSLPDEYLFKGSFTKNFLRDSLSELLPKSILYKQKQGFSIPARAIKLSRHIYIEILNCFIGNAK